VTSQVENTYQNITKVSLTEYPDIVKDAQIHHTPSGTPTKTRLYLIDESYMDIWLSPSGKYSYHWEQRHINGRLYRHDNAPHPKWSHIKTYPKHYHDGSQENVKESNISDNPIEAIQAILQYMRKEITSQKK